MISDQQNFYGLHFRHSLLASLGYLFQEKNPCKMKVLQKVVKSLQKRPQLRYPKASNTQEKHTKVRIKHQAWPSSSEVYLHLSKGSIFLKASQSPRYPSYFPNSTSTFKHINRAHSEIISTPKSPIRNPFEPSPTPLLYLPKPLSASLSPKKSPKLSPLLRLPPLPGRLPVDARSRARASPRPSLAADSPRRPS